MPTWAGLPGHSTGNPAQVGQTGADSASPAHTPRRRRPGRRRIACRNADAAGAHERPRAVRRRRQPVQTARVRVPLGRDLRRHPLDLRLRPARRAHAPQRAGGVVAGDDPRARRRRADRGCHPHEPQGLGGVRPPGDVHRPPRRLPQLQGALARRPDRRHLPQLRLQGPDRGPAVQLHVQDLRRSGRGGVRRRLPATRDGAGHVRQLRERTSPSRDASHRSGSPRSGGRSATRSRPATSSSAPASSR